MSRDLKTQRQAPMWKSPYKHIVIAATLLFGINTQCFSFQIEGLSFELEANSVIFNNKQKELNASDNVKLTYSNATIYSDKFYYSSKKRYLFLSDNIKLKSPAGDLLAKEFTFDFNSQEGVATSVSTLINNLIIKGDKMVTNKNKTKIKTCSLSTCNQTSPHYQIKSDSMELYPNTGDIVFKKNTIYILNTPIFYVPTYVYNSKTSQLEAFRRQNEPFPEFGYNRVDGSYFRINYAYFLTPYTSGVFSLGTSSKRGLMVGANHKQVLSPTKTLYLKGYHVSATGLEGGAIYEQTLLSYNYATNSFIENALSPFLISDKTVSTTLRAQYLHNEIINYQLVSYFPMIELDTKNINLPLEFKFDTKIGGGKIKDQQASSLRYHLENNLSKTIPLLNSLSLNNLITHKIFRYDNQLRLDQLFNKVSLAYDNNHNYYELSYTKKLLYDGQSPFSFDTDNTIKTDEMGFNFKQKIGGYTALFQGDYSLETKKARNLQYGLGVDLHCWQIRFLYNQVWEEFSLDVTLLEKY